MNGWRGVIAQIAAEAINLSPRRSNLQETLVVPASTLHRKSE